MTDKIQHYLQRFYHLSVVYGTHITNELVKLFRSMDIYKIIYAVDECDRPIKVICVDKSNHQIDYTKLFNDIWKYGIRLDIDTFNQHGFEVELLLIA